MNGTDPITGTEDTIDSRDVIARIEYLESFLAMGVEFADDGSAEELTALRALASEGEDNIADWQYGETLIHKDYFEEYAEQLAEDIGAINRDAAWPLTHIDWEAAADALLMDYTELTLNGHTFYAR